MGTLVHLPFSILLSPFIYSLGHCSPHSHGLLTLALKEHFTHLYLFGGKDSLN